MNQELTEIRARFYAELHENDEQLAKEKPGTAGYLLVILQTSKICTAYIQRAKPFLRGGQ